MPFAMPLYSVFFLLDSSFVSNLVRRCRAARSPHIPPCELPIIYRSFGNELVGRRRDARYLALTQVSSACLSAMPRYPVLSLLDSSFVSKLVRCCRAAQSPHIPPCESSLPTFYRSFDNELVRRRRAARLSCLA